MHSGRSRSASGCSGSTEPAQPDEYGLRGAVTELSGPRRRPRRARVTPAGRIAAAIELLAAIEAAPTRPADAVANDFFRARRFIGSGDRRAVSDRVWRVLRTWRRLGWWLADKPTPRLLVAASLLLEGGSLADVMTAFTGGQFAPAALAPSEQAALRRLQGRTLDHASMPDAVRLEMPDWLVPHLSGRYDAAELAALLEPAPLDLRVNLLKAHARGGASGAGCRGPGGDADAVFAVGPAHRGPAAGHHRRGVPLGAGGDPGRGQPACRRAGRCAAGMRVADLCAGAGGKTLALAMMMQNRGQLVACDVSAARLDGAVRRLRRAGVHNVERHLIEPGDKWAKRRAGSFDRVLVDAPCTGTGTWRRNPDARLRLTETDLAELLPKQAAILNQAASLVRIGGRLVYATCSLLSEENEDQVTAFLARHPGFALVPLARAWTAVRRRIRAIPCH